MKDFFISYSTEDEAWAEWIAWELDALGYSVMLQKWDFLPGSNFAVAMHAAIQECRRLVLVLSQNSLRSQFVSAEWMSFFTKDPEGKKQLIIPVRIDECEPTGLLGQIVYIDLHKKGEESAKNRLQVGIGHFGPKPVEHPIFPGAKALSISIAPTYPLSNDAVSTAQQEEVNEYISAATTGVLPTIKRRSLGRAFVSKHLQLLVNHYVKPLSSGSKLSVISLDVDGMGSINAKYGVYVGDLVMDRLCNFCEMVKHRLLVGRMGDDTLFVLLRGLTEELTLNAANQLIRTVRTADWNNLALGMYVYCSAGVAKFRKEEDAFDTVMRAVEGQKAAKRAGGNKAYKGPHYLPRLLHGEKRQWDIS